MILPPAHEPVIIDGFINPKWYEFFTRFSVLPFIAKAWAYITVSAGTPTLVDSYNIAAMADAGVGLFDLTLEKPFASASWVSLITTGEPNGAGVVGQQSTTTAKTASSIRINTVVITDGAGSTDPVAVNFVGYGKQ